MQAGGKNYGQSKPQEVERRYRQHTLQPADTMKPHRHHSHFIVHLKIIPSNLKMEAACSFEMYQPTTPHSVRTR